MKRLVLAADLGVKSDACAAVTATASLGFHAEGDVVSDEHVPASSLSSATRPNRFW
jgi:hypothetical protein